MSKKSKPVSGYVLNGIPHKTIERKNERGERVWVKYEPVGKPPQPIIVGNILDRPQDVDWQIKGSHTEEIHPTYGKQNYAPATNAGSFCVPSGVFSAQKDPEADVTLFPIDPINECEFEGNYGTGSVFSGSVDAQTYLGFLTTTGTITLL